MMFHFKQFYFKSTNDQYFRGKGSDLYIFLYLQQ